MFERILVPLDGSILAECVLPHAAALARAYNSEIMLLRVQDPANTLTRPRPVDPLEWQFRKAEAETYLQEIAGRLHSIGLQTRFDLLEGRAAESIVMFAHNHDVNLILMSSHGQSGLSPWNISSVVQQVIFRAKRSVMIVRAYEPGQGEIGELHYQRLLLPLDGSQRAEGALPVAESLARACGSQLLVAHVVRQPEIPRRTPPMQEDLDLANSLTERNRDEALKYLVELKSWLDIPVETRLLTSERVYTALHELAEAEEVDLVILSAHGYSGDSNWPYGSMVISFIVYGITPVLILQDIPEDRIQLTRAELAARKFGRR
jgi:nucleotide-binding universal stress UspA family protein